LIQLRCILFRREETYGSTERILEPGLKNRKKGRSCFGIKIGGPNPNFAYMRDTTDFSPASIKYALDNSLQRLQTDYIDLYQLYWPERKTNFSVKEGLRRR
jgi:aryl-alcohol dehydrogenase-like predicted oxidoreductase